MWRSAIESKKYFQGHLKKLLELPKMGLMSSLLHLKRTPTNSSVLVKKIESDFEIKEEADV